MCTKSLIVQVSASIMCKKHLWWPVTWNETQCGARGGCQRRLGARVVMVAVESSPLSTGRTCVEKRMTSITMPMINTVTRTQIIVQRVLRHHILRCTRWDVFLNVAAFTTTQQSQLFMSRNTMNITTHVPATFNHWQSKFNSGQLLTA